MIQRSRKIALAILCGLVVGLMAAGTHLVLMGRPLDRNTVLDAAIGDLIAALSTMVVCLAIQLRQEEVHYRTAIEKAALVAELNHHIRNSVFPLSLAIHKSGDTAAIGVAEEAVERINIALKDATADAFSGMAQYKLEAPKGKRAEQG